MNRSILLGLRSIPDEQRWTEKTYYSAFEEVRPRLLGAMFDAVSKAMTLVDDIKLSGLPRLADFCQWGCAFAKVLGFGEQAFLDAFNENAGLGHKEAIAGSLVAHALQCLMQSQNSWEGTPDELYVELKDIAEAQKLNTHSKGWPKASNALSRRLNEIASDLPSVGLMVETGDRSSSHRKVIIRRVTGNTVITVIPSSPHPISLKNNDLSNRDDSDGISRSTVEGADKASREVNRSPFRCDRCGGTEFWRHPQTDNQTCSTCHPPGNSDWMAPVRQRLAEIKKRKYSTMGIGHGESPPASDAPPSNPPSPPPERMRRLSKSEDIITG